MYELLCLAFQYHINKLSIMSSENHLNNSDKEVDEVDAALSDLEITLEGGKTSTVLVSAAGRQGRLAACAPRLARGRNSLPGLAVLFHTSSCFCTSFLSFILLLSYSTRKLPTAQ